MIKNKYEYYLAIFKTSEGLKQLYIKMPELSNRGELMAKVKEKFPDPELMFLFNASSKKYKKAKAHEKI